MREKDAEKAERLMRERTAAAPASAEAPAAEEPPAAEAEPNA